MSGRSADDLSPLTIVKALPKNATRAKTQQTWLEAVYQSEMFMHKREDGLQTIFAVAKILAFHAEWATMTTRPTWAILMERTGKSRRTIARALAELRDAGLLGIVSGGSTPETRPMALSHIEGNLASVYVLAVPSPLTVIPGEAQDSSRPVDKDGTPTGLTLVESNPYTHAREKNPHEPLRGTTSDGASRNDDSQPWRTGPLWPSHVTPKRKEERWAAGFALRFRLGKHAPISDKALAAICSKFYFAGWTNRDVLYAIDHIPEGKPWPHDGATGVRNIGAWLIYRLKAWQADGTVIKSLTQREQADHAHRLAQQRATEEKAAHQREQAHRVTPAAVQALRKRTTTLIDLRKRLHRLEDTLGITHYAPAPTAIPDVQGQTTIPRALVESPMQCPHGDTTEHLPTGQPRCPICRNKKNIM